MNWRKFVKVWLRTSMHILKRNSCKLKERLRKLTKSKKKSKIYKQKWPKQSNNWSCSTEIYSSTKSVSMLSKKLIKLNMTVYSTIFDKWSVMYNIIWISISKCKWMLLKGRSLEEFWTVSSEFEPKELKVTPVKGLD